MISFKNKKYDITKICLFFFFLLYPLILFQYDNENFYIQSLLLFFASMSWLLCNVLLIRKKEWSIRSVRYIADLPVITAVIFEIVQILKKMFLSNGKEAIRFDIEITVIAMAAVYWIISSGIVLHKYYLDITLYTGLLVFGLLLYRYLCDISFGSIIFFIAEDESAIAAYAILICTIATVQYCQCRDKMRSIFYFGVSVTGFFVLFINHNLVSICMMLTVFIAIPVLFRPVARLVKRDMQLFFTYMFLLSNMSLLTNYMKLIQKELTFNIENSVYLDLLIAIGGIVFLLYWDRIPEGMDLEQLVLRKMRRGYLFFLKTMAIFFAAILLNGERWRELPDSMLLLPLKRFAVALWEEVGRGESVFFLSFEKQGVMGGFLLLVFSSLIIARLRKNYHIDKPLTITLILISGLFLLQLLFWKPAINSLPIYFMILIFAAFYQEKRKEVSVRK